MQRSFIVSRSSTRRLFVSLVVLACAFLHVQQATAQSSYAMLMSVKPLAVQIGATTECEIVSRYSLHDVQECLVSGTGVRGEVVKESLAPAPKPGEKPKNDGSVKVQFTVDADAIPSPRDFRLTTSTGATTIAQLVLVRDPIVYETKDNDARDKAPLVALPATLCGSFEKGEDVDYFKFHAEAGQSLVFHVWAARQQDKIHDLQTHADPLLAVRNAAGVVLDADDNTFFADPLLQYTFRQAGDYFVEIRDVRYQGDRHWQYAIEVSPRPFVTTVFPLAVAPGATAEVEPIGKNIPASLGSPPKTTLTVPADAPNGLLWTQTTLDGQPTNAIQLEVSRLPLALETPDENNTVEKAQPIALPSGVNGRIDSPADVDCYSFEAKKGEQLCFEIVARRRQSSLDAVLSILDEKGKRLLENDDLRQGRFTYADAAIETWAAPADGRYVLEVRDLHLRGGAEFVYLLKAEKRTPSFRLDADSDKTLVTPGVRGAVFVRATRQGIDAPIELSVEGLPPGVTAHCGRIAQGANDGCIIFEAAPDAPKTVANIRIFGR
ncbi:MAG TPA: PPC domain-containing protein, partial [Pirellulales bacterium]